MIVEALRLGGVEQGLRRPRPHRERDARSEAAAGGGDRHHVGRQPAGGEVFDDFEARPCPGRR